jgi:SAM-dependent methyltransferase
MSYLEHNRRSWNDGAMADSLWARPVDDAAIERARKGTWEVLLTPRTPVPRAWLGDVAGRDVLCLASGGGQQAPILAAAGARVVSFDLSEEQLRKDRIVAERHGLRVACVPGDMADMSALADASFDLIFHPASNVFVADLAPVWRECARVLRPGGVLMSGFMNPSVFLFDHAEADETHVLTVRYALPYADQADLPPAKLQAKLDAREPLEFSHSLTAQIGGQIDAGFVIDGLYEDRWVDDSWLFSTRSPICIATRAVRTARSPTLESS